VLMFSMDYPSRWERERESNFCNFSLSEHNLCTFSLSIPSLQLLSQHIIFATTSLSIIYATSFLWAQSMHLLSANLFGNCLKSGPSLLNNLGFHSETVRMILCSWATIHCNNPGTLADCWHIALHCIALLAITGSNEVGVEIHCCQCCDCSCRCHSLNRYIDTMSCGRPTHWVVHRRRFLFIFLRARSCWWF
jgi:hypothetical protein